MQEVKSQVKVVSEVEVPLEGLTRDFFPIRKSWPQGIPLTEIEASNTPIGLALRVAREKTEAGLCDRDVRISVKATR